MKYILGIVFALCSFGQSVQLNGTIGLEGATTLTPIGSPQLSASPSTLTYSTQLVNQDSTTHTNLTSPQIITVTNAGTAALSVSNVAISGTNAADWYLFEDTCTGETVAAGGYCQLSVSFDPVGAGSRSAILSITDNAQGSPHSVSLSGIGAAGTTYYFSPNGNDSSGNGTLANPWKNLSSHNSAQGAGVVFVLRGGHYQTAFTASTSSSQAQPLVIKAYAGELPIMDYSGGGVIFSLYAPFVLDGILFQRSWSSNAIDIGSSSGVSGLIVNNTFREFGGQPIREGVTGKVSGLTIENNVLDTWGTPTAAGGSGGFNDGIVSAATGVSHVLIRNNYATRGGHYFSDALDQTGSLIESDNTIEQYWGGGFAETNLGTTGRFIQNNRLVHIGLGVIFTKACFEVQSSFTVVRKNICTDQAGNNNNNSIDIYAQFNAGYGDVDHVREYNNNYFNNGGYTWLIGQVTTSNSCCGSVNYTGYNHLLDAKIANDISYQNTQTQATFGTGSSNGVNDYTIWNDGDKDGLWANWTGPNYFLNTIIGGSSTFTNDINFSSTHYTVAQMQNNSANASGLLQTNPSWTNAGSALNLQGFELQSGSPAIAAGTHLTTTTAAGTNTNSVPVADPFWFTDGMGMVPGDLIQVGNNSPVRILTRYGPNSGEFLYSGGYGLRTNNPDSYTGGYFTVSAPITVTQVSRRCYSGNSQTHTVGIGTGFSGSGAFVTNGSATVNMAGCTPMTLVHANLPAPITLSPGVTYWEVSSEAANSDSYSDNYTIVPGSTTFSEIGGVYGNSLASLTTNTSVSNGQYVGLSFTYTSSLPSNTLIVGSPITFANGATVDLADHNGNAPDLGAVEYSPTAATISGVTESTTSARTASVTWTTGTPATSQCTWGITSYYGMTSVKNDSLVTSHSCYMTGLWPNTTYHYAVLSVDANGGRSISSDATFTTPAHPGPTITNVYECGVTSAGTQATICWTTSSNSTSQVFYNSPTDGGPADLRNASAVADTGGVTTHSVTLTGLSPFAAYHFSVQSTDVSTGVTSYSPISIFVTPNTATTGPLFSNVSVAAADTAQRGYSNSACFGPWNNSPGYCGYSNSQATFSWTASESVTNPKVGFITTAEGENAESQYSPTPPSNYDEWATLDSNSMVNVLGNSPSTSASISTTTPSMTIYRLSPNTAYYFYVQSKDANGVTNSSYRMMFTTPALDIPSTPTIPPQTYLTETATNLTASGATITWSMPSAATCQVEYGTTLSYGSTASGSSGTSCSVPLTGLSANTTYHVAVIPTNSAGMSFTGPDFTFTTP